MAPKLYLKYISPPCRAVLMVAKAIGLELDIEEVDNEQLKTPEMLEINPQHTVPILVDEDFTLWDSHAIAGYLVGKYAEDDSLYPKDDVQRRAIIDQRLHFENGVLFQRTHVAAQPLHMGIKEISEEDTDKVIEAYGFLEQFLNGHNWLVGDELTIADLSVLATIVSSEMLIPIDPDRCPKLVEWVQRGKDLPYFEECNATGLEQLKEFIDNLGQ